MSPTCKIILINSYKKKVKIRKNGTEFVVKYPPKPDIIGCSSSNHNPPTFVHIAWLHVWENCSAEVKNYLSNKFSRPFVFFRTIDHKGRL